MARNPRVAVPGYAYHLTQRGSNRDPVFTTIDDRRVYLKLLSENLESAGIRLLAYCLMTNHVHFIAVPRLGDSLSVWMRRVNGRYAQYFNAKSNRSGHLWQARFFSCPLSTRHLSVALRYVEQNPVRANMVSKPEDYRWSSAQAHLSGDLNILDPIEWDSRGGAPGWRALIQEAPAQPMVQMLRRCTFGGRPFGGPEFIKEIAERIGCEWLRWPYEQSLRDENGLFSLEGLDVQAKSAEFGG